MSNKLNKKSLLLSLGTVGMVTAPIATVIACGDAADTTVKVTTKVTSGNFIMNMVEKDIIAEKLKKETSSDYGKTDKQRFEDLAKGLKDYSALAKEFKAVDATVTTAQASKDGVLVGTAQTVSMFADQTSLILGSTSLSTAEQASFITALKATGNLKAFWDAINAKNLTWKTTADDFSTALATLGTPAYALGLSLASGILSSLQTGVTSPAIDAQEKVNALIEARATRIMASDISQKSDSTTAVTALALADIMIDKTDSEVTFTVISVALNTETPDNLNDYKIVVEGKLTTAVAGTVAKKIEIIKTFTPMVDQLTANTLVENEKFIINFDSADYANFLLKTLTLSGFGLSAEQIKENSDSLLIDDLKSLADIAESFRGLPNTVTKVEVNYSNTTVVEPMETVSELSEHMGFILSETTLSTSQVDELTTELEAKANFKEFWDEIKATNLEWKSFDASDTHHISALGTPEEALSIFLIRIAIDASSDLEEELPAIVGQKKINDLIEDEFNMINASEISILTASSTDLDSLTTADIEITKTDDDVVFTIISMTSTGNNGEYKIVVEGNLKTPITGTVAKKVEITKTFTA